MRLFKTALVLTGMLAFSACVSGSVSKQEEATAESGQKVVLEVEEAPVSRPDLQHRKLKMEMALVPVADDGAPRYTHKKTGIQFKPFKPTIDPRTGKAIR